MTRIIQMCLLVLALTGVLLSSTTEATISDVSESTKSSEQTPPSTPAESTSHFLENSSSSTLEKEDNGLFSESEVNSSNSGKTNVSDFATSSQDETTMFVDSEITAAENGDSKTDNSVPVTIPSLKHSEGLFKAELQDAELNSSIANHASEDVTDLNSTEQFAAETRESGYSGRALPGENSKSDNATDVASEIAITSTRLEFVESVTDGMKPESYTSNSEQQTSVPSVEELIYSSSHVAKQSENVSSTIPSKVQTEEKADTDMKSATRKRSVNATNTANTPTQSSSTSAIDVTPLHTELSTEADDVKYEESSNISSANIEVTFSVDTLSNNSSVESNSGEADVVHSAEAVATIPFDPLNVKDSTDHPQTAESEQSRKSPISSQEVSYIPSMSSVALSTSNGESIHFSESLDTREEISELDHSIYRSSPSDLILSRFRSPSPVRSEIEKEDGPSANSQGSFENDGYMVTFDPNGMTNNYTQDPDSITFSPVFHANGVSTDRYFSRLDVNELLNNHSGNGHEEITSLDNTEYVTTSPLSNLSDIHFSEREREFIPIGGLVPHDEPDKEEEMFNKFSTVDPIKSKPKSVDTVKQPTRAQDDESEEMLNDAPQFIQSQSTLMPSTNGKSEDTNKVSNDISFTAASSSYTITSDSTNELGLSIVYQTEQSAIRPVTVASPLQTAETISHLPESVSHDSISHLPENKESHSSTDATKPELPDTFLPETSSPIILPNPAPTVSTIVNKNADETVVVLQLNFTSVSNASGPGANKNEENMSSVSTIAGVAVKTSVSVSLPLSNASNGSFSSTESQANDSMTGTLESDLTFPVVQNEKVTTPVPTTTETEEPFSIEPFTGFTQLPIVTNEDDVTLIKVAGYIMVDKGLRWHEQLDNRHSPQYKEKANFIHQELERLFRTSSIAPHLWKIQIDGFSGRRDTKSVAVDFFMYLIKSKDDVPAENLTGVFHRKLQNNTFSRFRVDPTQTSFEFVTEEPLKAPTPPPEDVEEPMIPQWAIAVIVVGAASLIFFILFTTVAILGRHHMRRRYSNKLNDEDSDRPSDWETKMAAAYENLAADTIYDVEDMHSDTYKKSVNSTYNGRHTSRTPSRTPRRADSWSSSDWSPPPRRPRPQFYRVAY